MLSGPRLSHYVCEKWKSLISLQRCYHKSTGRDIVEWKYCLENKLLQTTVLKTHLNFDKQTSVSFNRTHSTMCQRHYQQFKNKHYFFKPFLCLSRSAVQRNLFYFYSTKSSRFTLKNEIFKEYMNFLEAEFNQETVTQNAREKWEFKKRREELRPAFEIHQQLKEKYEELDELTTMQTDEEMKALVAEEKETCIKEIAELEESLVDVLTPEEVVDDCDIILEVESGAGGQEAMIFAQDILNLYQNHSPYKGWKFNLVNVDNHEAGGIRSASATISGHGVYREMKYEGGVHRVQRVPKTEKSGRIHTSTMTVAILPQPREIDIVINSRDLRVDTFRSSGPGGQNVNKLETAVRLTHLPTGTVAECQQTRSQIKNKELALTILRTRLYEKDLQAQMSDIRAQRKIQVGNKDRSEKIRTYNYPQDRITDHRLGYNVHNIGGFMSGGQSFDNLVSNILEEAKKENLELSLEEFEKSRLSKQKAKK